MKLRLRCLRCLPGIALPFVMSTRLSAQESAPVCPPPVLTRLVSHRVAPGETVESIARQYNLIPATLMGLNPGLRSGQAIVGTKIVIPPYNGVRVEVARGQSLRDLAAIYQVRADVLFEVNGCQTAPKVVFVPGVNWSPTGSVAGTIQPDRPTQLTGYPLPTIAPLLLGYGWQVTPTTGAFAFQSGVDLSAKVGTPVLAAGNGTIAFAGAEGSYGNLVVINHQGGWQTRYAHLATVNVTPGQQVKVGQVLGTVGTTGKLSSSAPHLHFEIRSASKLGWVANDPTPFIKDMQIRNRELNKETSRKVYTRHRKGEASGQ